MSIVCYVCMYALRGGHTFVIKFANPPQVARIRIRLFHVVFQSLDAMLAGHELRFLVAVEVGPVFER